MDEMKEIHRRICDLLKKEYEIEIISDPPGAIIEWGNNYIGKTPLIYKYTGKIGVFASWTVTATPAYPGGYTQTKYFKGSNVLPRKIYFNTNLRPVR